MLNVLHSCSPHLSFFKSSFPCLPGMLQGCGVSRNFLLSTPTIQLDPGYYQLFLESLGFSLTAPHLPGRQDLRKELDWPLDVSCFLDIWHHLLRADHPPQSFISILSKYKSTEQEATEIREVRDGTWLKHNRHHLSLYFLEHSDSWIKWILIANQHWHAMFCCRVFWCSPWYTRPEMLWLALTSCTVPRRHCLCCSLCKGYVLAHKGVSPGGPGWSSP